MEMKALDTGKIEEILISEDYLPKRMVDRARGEAKRIGISTLDYIISEGLITRNLLGQAIAESYGTSYANLDLNEPTAEEIQIIPEDIARNYCLVVFRNDTEKIIVASCDPSNGETQNALKQIFSDKKIDLYFAFKEDIERLSSKYKQSLDTRFSKLLKEAKEVAPEMLDEIFNDAIDYRASDIHFEPGEEEAIIRFRIDSILREAGKIELKDYEMLLNRIKVKSETRIDEHYNAQDGAIRYTRDNKKVDMRVSILPTVNGEKVVIRILSKYISSLTMTDLGLPVNLQEIIHRVLKKQYGTIIITGPTGSGKTTTLYSILRLLNSPSINITTIEDPIEYKVEGINQIQTDEKAGLSFARGLRSIVRQDPDVILVGEIRDEETADMAVNTALSGHLLLSTFHANDSASTIPRLIDMGIKPYLLSSTLDVVVSQRLVRKICDNCRVSENMTKSDIEKNYPEISGRFGRDNEITLYKGKGCKSCNQSGYKGRIALFEFFKMTREMKETMIKNPSAQNISDVAKTQGMETFLDDGIEKVKNGMTTLEEISRVAVSMEL